MLQFSKLSDVQHNQADVTVLAQAGFRRGYSAIDNVFCLQTMVQTYLSRTGGRFYCLYVDFKKAFDKIKLFESILSKGVDGNFLNMLYEMYSNLKSCVKASSGGETTISPVMLELDNVT